MPRRKPFHGRPSPSCRSVPYAAIARVLREIADGPAIEGQDSCGVRPDRAAARSREGRREPVDDAAVRYGRPAAAA